MAQFITKQKIINAVQFDGANVQEIFDEFGQEYFGLFEDEESGDTHLVINPQTTHLQEVIVGQWVTPDEDTGRFKTIEPDEMVIKYAPFSPSIPTLAEDATLEEIVARVRFSLVQIRPMSEVDMICERLLAVQE